MSLCPFYRIQSNHSKQSGHNWYKMVHCMTPTSITFLIQTCHGKIPVRMICIIWAKSNTLWPTAVVLFVEKRKSVNIYWDRTKLSRDYISLETPNFPLDLYTWEPLRSSLKTTHHWGILVKLVICVVPGHWKIKILNLNKKISFFCFFYVSISHLRRKK